MKKIKINPLFRKKYTEKQYQKKILKKLFVPADRDLIESVFTTIQDPKNGHTLYTIDVEKVTTPVQGKKLNAIAKEIKKQKGRFKIGSIVAALVCITLIGLTVTVFRNQIARIALTSTLERTFGARAEIGMIDFDLLNTRFVVEKLSVANKNAPMTNLFEIGKTELFFDLLELSRGKVVANNIEVTGVTWNTSRTKSGALPAKQLKAFDKKQAQKAKNAQPNPVGKAIQGEVDKLKSGISLDSGISGIKNQLDPVQFLETEKASLLSPAVVSTIKTTVPELSAKWSTKGNEVRADVDKTLADGKKITAIKVDSIKTVEEAQAALRDIQTARSSTEKSLSLAQETSRSISEDTAKVTSLSKEAENALKADSARLKNLADSVKSVNLDSGKTMVSGVFNTFFINTLGSYYPYAQKGLGFLREMQNGSKKTKKQSLKTKSSAMERLSGRDFAFGSNSAPRFLAKKVHLSAMDNASNLSVSAEAQNITDDADAINKPISALISVAQGKTSENVNLIVDLRREAVELLKADFTAMGYPLSLSSGNVSGVPSISGNMKATGVLVVTQDEAFHFESNMLLSEAKATVAAFEPALLYTTYRDTLSVVKDISLSVRADISPTEGVSLAVTTDLDSVLKNALSAQMAKQVEQFKAGIKKEGEAYLASQKKEYSAEIERFTDISGKSKAALDDIKNYDQTLQAKKAEIEKRIQAIAIEKAAPVQKAATDAGKKATDSIKKLF